MRTSFWTRLLDLVSPRMCVVCDDRLSVNERVLCASCHLHLPLTGFERSAFDNPMARLFWGLFPVERAAALFFYEPQTDNSRIIHEMKYHDWPEVGEAMGEITARRFLASGFFDGIDAMVPMPITRFRKWERGYNQSFEIAKGVKSVVNLPIYTNVVKRITFVKSQTTMNAWERRSNVEGAFQLTHADRIAGKHLLLIDDIVTTGATIISCATELAKAKDVRISILTLGMTKS